MSPLSIDDLRALKTLAVQATNHQRKRAKYALQAARRTWRAS